MSEEQGQPELRICHILERLQIPEAKLKVFDQKSAVRETAERRIFKLLSL